MEALGLLGVLTLWGALGLLGHTTTLIATRRPAPALALPLSVLAGIAGALLVPALGAKGALGFAISLPAALGAGALASMAPALWPQMGTDGH
jgi:hypothetical protein